jgi:arabinose-5-phosphate isomerase
MDYIKTLINHEINAIKAIPISKSQLDVIVEVIDITVNEEGSKVITSGVGKAGNLAHHIATIFCSIGVPAVFLHPLEAQHGDLGILQEDDILFVISNSGQTREIVELIELAEQLNHDLFIIALTGNKNSKIAKMCDSVIHTGNPQEICPLGLTPTSSITVMMVVVNILVYELINKTGLTRQSYGLFHHSGYLGEKCK